MKRYTSFILVATLVLAFSLLWGASALAQEGGDDEQLQLGAQIYAANCAVCHGANGEGRVGATLAKDWPSIRPELATRATIANGVPGSPMPAWSEANGGPLSDEEIDAVVYYILSWQTGGAPQVTPLPSATPLALLSPVPGVEGDPNRGAALFAYNCEVCHGEGGVGRIGAPLAKVWPSVRPDLAIKNTISNGVEGSPMPAWSKENGGPLTEQEINDLTAYVLSLAEGVHPPATETPEAPSGLAWLSGWGGVLLTVLLFVLLLVASQFLQRRKTR